MKLQVTKKSVAIVATLAALITATAISTSANARPSSKATVNLTVTNIPVSITKASKLESIFRVCAVPLAADATTIATSTITSCSERNSVETKAVGLAAGTWSGTLRLNAPRTADTSNKYALYVEVRRSRDLGLASQFGSGQFVSVANVAGTPTVTAGLTGLTLDLAANAGSGAISKVVPVTIPDDGKSYALLVTKIDSGSESAAAYIPVALGTTSVTLPSNLKGGNYRVQLIQTSAGDTFALDSKKFLDEPIEHLTHH